MARMKLTNAPPCYSEDGEYPLNDEDEKYEEEEYYEYEHPEAGHECEDCAYGELCEECAYFAELLMALTADLDFVDVNFFIRDVVETPWLTILVGLGYTINAPPLERNYWPEHAVSSTGWYMVHS